MKAREQRGRAGSVEAFIVIENSNPQVNSPLYNKKTELPELFSIKGAARSVKGDSCPTQDEPEAGS
jgi:hypothetical protein